MSNKELIYAWKLTIFDNTPLVQETIAAFEAADKEIARVQSLHEGLMKNADKMNDELRAEIAALKAHPRQMRNSGLCFMDGMTMDELIKHMTDRFLGWKLPEDFAPDAGIKFSTTFPPSSPAWPIGTNLFTADQAKQMFEHCLGAAPQATGEKK